MKKFLLATVGLIALGMTAPASAADLAARPYTKAPPIAAPMMYDWSGFYIGANGGYGWARQCADVAALNGVAFFFAEGCNDKGGGIVGGQIGYRWQAGTWVFGLEAQGDWANLRTERQSLFFPGATYRSQIDALGLFTGQVGYAWNNTLLYVKGGAAVVNQRFDLFDTVGGFGIAQAERTRWGGVVGVGLEYGFAPNWTAGIEYDYIFRQSDNTVLSTPLLAPITTVSTRTSTEISMVTGRISYKFGGYGYGGGPARY
jgi:outer membrane immunogenic protein